MIRGRMKDLQMHSFYGIKFDRDPVNQPKGYRLRGTSQENSKGLPFSRFLRSPQLPPRSTGEGGELYYPDKGV